VAERAKIHRSDIVHDRAKESHKLLDELTMVRTGDDVGIALIDAEFGDELEADWMPLAYIEYDDHADQNPVGVGGRDGRYPVAVRHLIEHPTSILTDSKPSLLPLAVQIGAASGSETW